MAATKAKSKAKKTTAKAASASKTKALAASRARKKSADAKPVAAKKPAPKTVKPSAPQPSPEPKAEAASAAKSAPQMSNVVDMFSPQNFAENSPFKNADAFKDMMSGNTEEWQKIQDKFSQSSEEIMAHIERSSETLSSMASDTSDAMQRSSVLASDVTSKSTEATQDAINSWFDFSNRFWSDTIEQSKEFLNCRNANDVFDLQNQLIQHATESLYKQASESSEKLFETFADVATPAQEEASKAAEAFFANLTK